MSYELVFKRYELEHQNQELASRGINSVLLMSTSNYELGLHNQELETMRYDF